MHKLKGSRYKSTDYPLLVVPLRDLLAYSEISFQNIRMEWNVRLKQLKRILTFELPNC